MAKDLVKPEKMNEFDFIRDIQEKKDSYIKAIDLMNTIAVEAEMHS